MEIIDCVVSRSQQVTETIHHVAIRSAGGRLPSYRPGQYVDFFIPTSRGTKRRSYSIGTPGRDGDSLEEWDFFVARVPGGLGSEFLVSLKPGDRLKTTTPTGIFTLRGVEPRRLVLVATSTGVAPFRSMRPRIEELLQQSCSVSLLFGCRNAADLLFVQEWHELLESREGFEFVPCFSKPRGAEEHLRWGAILGRVQVGLKRLPLISRDATYLLCGNPNMVDEVEELLISEGVSEGQILLEGFVFAG